LNWCFVIHISQGLIWQRDCCLTISSLMFGTNALMFGTNDVVVITEYWNSNYLHDQWIGRSKKVLEIKCTTEHWRSRFWREKFAAGQIILWNKMRRRQDLSKKMRRNPDFWTEYWWVVSPDDISWNSFFTNHCSEEGMVAERPRKKGEKNWAVRQVRHDSISRFCCYRCSTLFNYNSYSCTGAFVE